MLDIVYEPIGKTRGKLDPIRSATLHQMFTNIGGSLTPLEAM
ncbi:hypothetical protein N9H39_00910 [Gammaproteobacteria bacterium]|nr:hypothetical protein [Gammaproteobacteria bacterium]